MDTPVIVAIISAAVAVVAPAISFYLTKRKEREADWQKYKFEQYKEFIAALSGVVGGEAIGRKAAVRAFLQSPAPACCAVRHSSTARLSGSDQRIEGRKSRPEPRRASKPAYMGTPNGSEAS